MRATVVIDDKLLYDAMELSECKTKKDLINQALNEFVLQRKRKNLLDLEGKLEFSDNYDYKKLRESNHDFS